MKKAVLTLATIVGAIVFVACSSTAQPRGMGQGQRGWGPGSAYGRIYDSQAVETISGVIVSIGTFSPDAGSSQGVHLVLKNDKETISVHLGPSWFIDNLEPKLSANDTIEIRGSRVTFDGKPAIIAAEIKKDNETLTLRDASGFPVWRGWRRQ